MSYCRWSSYGWKCDVYVYEDAGGGWTTHVASRKRVSATPCPELDWEAWRSLPEKERAEAFSAWHKSEREWLDSSTLVDIGLEFDGERFNDPTPEACAATLRMLKGVGYWVPEDVIVELENEHRLEMDDGEAA